MINKPIWEDAPAWAEFLDYDYSTSCWYWYELPRIRNASDVPIPLLGRVKKAKPHKLRQASWVSRVTMELRP